MKSWLLVALLTCSIAFAQETNTKPPKPEPEPCTVSGRVVKRATGEPLKSARVLLREYETANGHSYTQYTDANGQFVFKNVTPGRYDFEAHHNGFIEEYYHPEGASAAAILDLTPGQKLEKVLFRLTAAAAIVGRIMDEDAEPAPSIQVQILTEDSNGPQKVWDDVTSSFTDDLGQFRLFGIPPGEYYFSATDTGMPDLSPMNLAAGRGFHDESMAKHPVSYYPGVLHRDQAQKISLKAGEEFHLEMALKPAQSPVSVSGIVIGPSGAPIAGASVDLLDREETVPSRFAGTGAATDAKGHFQINNVFSSNYRLGASWENGGKTYLALEAITVGAENITNIRLALKSPVTVIGTVIAKKNFDFVGHKIFVGLVPIDHNFQYQIYNAGMVQQDGTFSMNLFESTYAVKTQGLPEGWYLRSARLNGEDGLEHGTKIEGTGPQKLELYISHTAASLEGAVSMEDKPAIGASIRLVPAEENPSRLDLHKATTTDQNGHFILTSIVPGAYKISAKFDEDGIKESPELSRKLAEMNVELSEKETKTIKLEIKEPEAQ
jgi:protocatechuate 3,4-dioxygenase beta subunit